MCVCVCVCVLFQKVLYHKRCLIFTKIDIISLSDYKTNSNNFNL